LPCIPVFRGIPEVFRGHQYIVFLYSGDIIYIYSISEYSGDIIYIYSEYSGDKYSGDIIYIYSIASFRRSARFAGLEVAAEEGFQCIKKFFAAQRPAGAIMQPKAGD